MLKLDKIVSVYTNRFDVKKLYNEAKPSSDLSLIIAIPSYKEPDILTTLESLSACIPPKGFVELIIVINAPENASQEVLNQNKITLSQIESFKLTAPEFLSIQVILEESLPVKHAGAGLARKTGMDEAVQRWALLGNDGPIVCLDADCTVSSNYLVEVEKTYQNENVSIAHFNYEHVYQEETNEVLRDGIINYELHLRCYVQGLKYAGFKFAVHTVGSSMTCRASLYAKMGGMNRRRAGEDFYFLHKLVPHGVWEDIKDATVYPSCRVSDRVPFGTGRAQMEWVEAQESLSYNPEVYELMKPFFSVCELWFDNEVCFEALPNEVVQFLNLNKANIKMEEMKRQSTSLIAFTKRFWEWMDGFMVMKLTHFLRDNGYPDKSVFDVGNSVLQLLKEEKQDSLENLLDKFRQLDLN